MTLLVAMFTSVTALAQTPGWELVTEKPAIDGGQNSNWGSNGSENYDKLVDGDLTTKYELSDADPWVEFHYQKAFIPKGYILWTANDSDGNRNPLTWIIMAKNEGDADWTVLDDVDNRTNSRLTKENNSKSEHILNNNKAYQYYRFEATRRNNEGALQFQLAELQFYAGLDLDYVTEIPTVTGGANSYFSNENYGNLVYCRRHPTARVVAAH